MRLNVMYEGIHVGYSNDKGKTIEFLDTEEAKKVKNNILKGHNIFVSSRNNELCLTKKENSVLSKYRGWLGFDSIMSDNVSKW